MTHTSGSSKPKTINSALRSPPVSLCYTVKILLLLLLLLTTFS